MKIWFIALALTAATSQVVAGWSCTMPNGAVVFRQLSECPADAVHAEQHDTALPNPGPRPRLPNPQATTAPPIFTPAQDPELEQSHGVPLGQPRGYIQNERGDKCWFVQTTVQRVQYFQTLPNKTATLTFDNPRCMKKSELGQDVNKMLINKRISQSYARTGAQLQTRVDELYKTSLLQVRGQCIQSATYPVIGVLVEYHEADDSIYMVKHAPSVGHCSNQPVTKFD